MNTKLKRDPATETPEELDALAKLLPAERREALAALLMEDVATLKHLAGKGMGANTLRALASCVVYAAIQILISLPLHAFVLPGIGTASPTLSPTGTLLGIVNSRT